MFNLFRTRYKIEKEIYCFWIYKKRGLFGKWEYITYEGTIDDAKAVIEKEKAKDAFVKEKPVTVYKE